MLAHVALVGVLLGAVRVSAGVAAPLHHPDGHQVLLEPTNLGGVNAEADLASALEASGVLRADPMLLGAAGLARKVKLAVVKHTAVAGVAVGAVALQMLRDGGSAHLMAELGTHLNGAGDALLLHLLGLLRLGTGSGILLPMLTHVSHLHAGLLAGTGIIATAARAVDLDVVSDLTRSDLTRGVIVPALLVVSWHLRVGFWTCMSNFSRVILIFNSL
jgi:hypothetical protein